MKSKYRFVFFLVETDKYQGKVLYEQIIAKAKKNGIAGATVFRGVAGFGRSGQIRTSKILRLSLDLPILIEIIDTEENINKLFFLVSNSCLFFAF